VLRYKKYKDYQSYKDNQVVKPRQKEEYIRQKSTRKYNDFLRSFEKFNPFFGGMRRILCLGARFGEEVKAFRDLGHYALGVDLYADETDLVVEGDWNNLLFEDNSYDVIYTNSIDHCYDLKVMINEIGRVLTPDGIVIIDMAVQHCHAAEDKIIEAKFADPERYEAMLWNDDKDVIDPFVEFGFEAKMVWLEMIFHTYLLERKSGKTV
jgi:SAM-dependent methyltransferase